MKKFFLSVVTAAAALTTLSADQLYVIMKDGSVESYPTEKLDSISFDAPQIEKIMGFNDMATEIIKLKAQFDSVSSQIFVLTSKIDSMDSKMSAMTSKMDSVDLKMSAMTSKMDSEDLKMSAMTSKMDSMDLKMAATDSELAVLKYNLEMQLVSDFKYSVLNDKEVEVVGFINESADVVIPSTALVDGKMYTVTRVAEEAFKDHIKIKTVTLPKTLKSIGNSAFSDCSGLTSIEIPSGVSSIGKSSFMNCSGLTNLEIPSSVTFIGYSAFSGCSNLSIMIDNPRYEVDCKSAFGASSRVKSVDFKGSYLNFSFNDETNTAALIGSYLFAPEISYTPLSKVVIPSKIERNGKVYTVTEIGGGTFWSCDLLSIDIPSTVTKIGANAFMGCRGLSSIMIPSSVTEIEEDAFYGCSSLDVVIDNSRYNIKYLSVLCGVNSVKFTGSPLNLILNEENSTAEIAPSYSYCLNESFGTITTLSIPSEVNVDEKKYTITSIGEGAFAITGLKNIEVPSTVTKIGSNAFYSCGLTKIELSSSVVSIGNFAFADCKNLTSITIPSRVTSIGESAFSGCENLDVVIDNSESNVAIGQNAFSECKSVKFLY